MRRSSPATPIDIVKRQLELEQQEAIWHARRSMLAFTCYTMPGYEINWHHRVICRVLDDFAAGRITRLMVTLPPRAGKSQLVSRHLPAYLLGRDPDLEIISASYGATLAERMNRDVQRIMTCDAYKQVFPDTLLNEKNIRTVAQGSWLRNSETFEVVGRRGKYLCAGVGGPLTGHGSDVAIVDDPTRNWQDAQSALIRERQWEWYSSVLYTRLSKQGRICLCTTRWHEDDLAGRLQDKAAKDPSADQWTVINLPAINEDGPGDYDPRQMGQALWPQRFPIKSLHTIRSNSERVFTSLYQGRPAPAEGDVVKNTWWRRYLPAELPAEFDFMGLSADLTFKDTDKGDYNVFQIWGRRGADLYLLEQKRGKMAFTQQLATFRDLCQAWPQLRAKWVEDTANGAALIDHVRKAIPGVIPITPRGSKLARAEAVATYIQAGNVHIPAAGSCDWVAGFLLEWAAFPNGKHDDQVDATQIGLEQMMRKSRLTNPIVPSLPSLGKVSRWGHQGLMG